MNTRYAVMSKAEDVIAVGIGISTIAIWAAMYYKSKKTSTTCSGQSQYQPKRLQTYANIK